MGTEVDDQGRLYIPKRIRDRYGDRFRIAELRSGIKLIPVCEDPVQGLRDAMPGIQGTFLRTLREDADEAARTEARD